MASNRPSGETAGFVQFDGVLRSADNVPDRSSHRIGAVSASVAPAAYTNVPVFETSNWAPPDVLFDRAPSIAGTAEPVTSSRSRSNGAANMVLSRKKSRCPLATYRA